MPLKVNQITKQIKLGRVIAVLQDDFGPGRLIEIGDALLAAPVLATEITLNTTNALEAITILRERAGENMLVGAGNVQTVAQAKAVLAVGAQFLSVPKFNPRIAAIARTADILYLPHAQTPADVETATTEKCRILKFTAAGETGAADLKALNTRFVNIDFIASGGITLDNIAHYVHDAAAVSVGGGLVPDTEVSMATVISTARALQSAWDPASRAP